MKALLPIVSACLWHDRSNWCFFHEQQRSRLHHSLILGIYCHFGAVSVLNFRLKQHQSFRLQLGCYTRDWINVWRQRIVTFCKLKEVCTQNTLARLINDLTKFFKLYTKGRQIIDENSPATSEKAQQNTMLILLQVGFLSVLVISSCLSGHIY